MTIFTYIQTEIKEIRDQLERDEVKRAIKKACKRVRERAIRELAAEARREAINKIKNEIKAEMAAKAQQEQAALKAQEAAEAAEAAKQQAHTQSLADSMVLLTCTSCGASISDPVTQLCETCNSNRTDSTDS